MGQIDRGMTTVINIATCKARRHALAVLGGLFLLQFTCNLAAAEAQSFTIFFDWERTVLTPNAKKIVGFIRESIKPSARVIITGHCDTSEAGPDKISLARALEVEKELVAAGLPSGVSLTILSKGSAEPHTPTGPKTREPTNRFVGITVE